MERGLGHIYLKAVDDHGGVDTAYYASASGLRHAHACCKSACAVANLLPLYSEVQLYSSTYMCSGHTMELQCAHSVPAPRTPDASTRDQIHQR